MSVGLFDFHDHSTDDPTKLHDNLEERFVNLCLNRFKFCEMDAGSHKYKLDTAIEEGKKTSIFEYRKKSPAYFILVCFTFNATDDFDVEKYLANVQNETISYCG